MSEINTEIPRERFKRLATARTNAVLNKLRILGNCANRSAYEYADEDIDKIFSVIERQVKETKMRFQYRGNKEEFKL